MPLLCMRAHYPNKYYVNSNTNKNGDYPVLNIYLPFTFYDTDYIIYNVIY